ncbi:hypothetical protein NQ317_013985 [Molorchus minor]|uniref:Uncharacterized protein n=1 Tax=Molorchus minor TaxID=1323400 RepID=A0ABQ9IZV6_9CUCU|nr:hypothetical protein NQ317_013985 [Molorchus minor]
MEAYSQFPENVNVWAGILDDRIVRPIFIDGSLIGQQYLELLRDDLFTQDEAPPRYSRIIRDYLDEVFQNRWIRRRGFVECRRSGLTAVTAFYFRSSTGCFSLQFDIEETGRKRVKVVLKKTCLSGVKDCGISCGSGREHTC